MTRTLLILIYILIFIPIAAKEGSVGNNPDTVETDSADVTLGEVVVTARESKGMSTASHIGRDALKHLQPTSLTDVLELLPGGITQNPDMGSANNITLRETGTVNATGSKTKSSDDYAITSLGTAFVVDGAPIATDADLQAVPSSTAADAAGRRSTVNRGVDMRSISTDNIESIDIIRGIPSAEFGNLTSGVVNIKRTRRATPLTARFKADEYSKLLTVGKGIAVRGQIINLDLGWLDSKVDPRDNLENYKRLTGGVRGSFRRDFGATGVQLNTGVDYTGSFDDARVDPDLNYNKIDEYKSTYNRTSLLAELTVNPYAVSWLDAIALNLSLSYQNDVTDRRKQVAPKRASIAPTSMSEGVHDGQYLLREYIAECRVESKPLDFFAKIRAAGTMHTGNMANQYKIGIEWTTSKNYGRGQIYDLTRPLSASWTTRPRDFSEIPALNTLSFFAEDNATLRFSDNTLQLQVGIRGISMPTLGNEYAMSGKVYPDPRLNALWTIPAFTIAGRKCELRIGGGFGLTTRMPTMDYLYPQVHYTDLVQLNYYDVNDPDNLSKVSLRTYIHDPVNHDLRPARNRKAEIRLGFEIGRNNLDITFFDERMRDGFRYSTIYAPHSFRKYDISAISGVLTAPPVLDELPYSDISVLDGMQRVTNGSRIDKRGVELQLNTARWQPLHTALTVTGAWFRSRYSNSQKLYYAVSDVVGNTAVSDKYVGIYDSNDGRVNDQLSTNLMFDTQITRWGLNFTSTIQCMWWLKTTRLRENGMPTEYIASDGVAYPFTEASATDTMLKYLIRTYNDDQFHTIKVPTAVYFNLKMTKDIGRWLRISAFVNRIFDYMPDYKSNGILIRRSTDAYFGMEATLKF